MFLKFSLTGSFSRIPNKQPTFHPPNPSVNLRTNFLFSLICISFNGKLFFQAFFLLFSRISRVFLRVFLLLMKHPSTSLPLNKTRKKNSRKTSLRRELSMLFVCRKTHFWISEPWTFSFGYNFHVQCNMNFFNFLRFAIKHT